MSDLLGLRPYQVDAVEAVEKDWRNGIQRPALAMATGTGKTLTATHIIARHLERIQRPALFLVHRDELAYQSAETFGNFGLDVGVIKAERNDVTAPVMVGSVQTLGRASRRSQLPGNLGLIVVDEAHHATAASYRAVLTHGGAFDSQGGSVALGLSATLTRGDGQGLGQVWQNVSYTYDILDGIAAGYLTDVIGRVVTVDGMSLANAKISGGDFTATSLSEILSAKDTIDTVVAAHQEHARDMYTFVFTPDVDSARRYAAAFQGAGYVAEAVWGDMDVTDRRLIMKRARAGEIQILVNCGIFTEGTDLPRFQCAVIARPTRNEGLYCLDSQTEILTDQGWRGSDDDLNAVRPAAFDLDTGEIHWSPLLSRVDRSLGPEESMFALSSPTADVRVSDRHRMIWRGRSAGWRVSEAAELSLRKSSYRVPIAGNQKASGVSLTDDEVRFVAWFMTDGTINKTTNQISISQSEHQPWNRDIVTCLIGCGFKYGVHRTSGDTNFSATSDRLTYSVSKGSPRGRDSHLRGWGALKPFLSKDMSPALDDMTREQLAVFLESAHQANGAKQSGQSWTRRSYHISTGNRTFADRLQSLCVRRGFKCNLAVHSYNVAPLYVLHVKDVTEKWIGGAGASDRESLTPVAHHLGERVWCVETDAGTIITRRNGKVMIVGNCQMVGRVLRPFPGKGDALVLDVAGVSQDHRLATLADLSTRRIGEVRPGESLKEAAAREIKARNSNLAGYVISSEEVDLFHRSRSVWLQTHGGVWFIPVGNAVVYLHPAKRDGLYHVGIKPVDGVTKTRPVKLDVPLDLAMSWGEQYADTYGEAWQQREGKTFGMTRSASWRRSPASPKMIEYAVSLGIEVPEKPRAGDLSCIIEVNRASQVLDGKRNQ